MEKNKNMYNQWGHTEIALKVKQQYPEGTVIRINHLEGEDSTYDGKEGVVEMIDDTGNIHGTWGGLAIIPNVDDFEIVQ